MNFDMFLPYVSRVAASAVAGLSVVVGKKIGVTNGLDPDTAQGVGTFLAGSIFAITHRLIDKRINPGDVARPSTVEVVSKIDTTSSKSI